MGIPKLWDHIRDASCLTTFAQLAEENFVRTPGTRGFRIGIDASIWLFANNSAFSQMDAETIGPNPELRNLFFKLLRLKSAGFLVLLVFDGPNAPKRKRGHYGSHQRGLNREEKRWAELANAVGCEWVQADGEAEAELANYAKRGLIDGVMTDDVDAIVFGADLVIRNTSPSLGGSIANFNKAAKHGKFVTAPDRDSKSAVFIYRYSDIQEKCRLTRSTMVLVAIFAGGDYVPEGLKSMGDKTAVKLGQLGWGDKLVEAYERFHDNPRLFEMFLEAWRPLVAQELRTNEHGLLSSRKIKLADALLQSTRYPTLDLVKSYLHPNVNPSPPPINWSRMIDVQSLVAYTSETFEWSNAWIQRYFMNNMWMALLMEKIREIALERDKQSSPLLVPSGRLDSTFASTKTSTPRLPKKSTTPLLSSSPLADYIKTIHDYDCQDSTENVYAHRIELDPDAFAPAIIAYLPDPDPNPDAEIPPPSQAPSLSLPPPSLSPLELNPNASPVKRRPPAELKGRGSYSHWISRKVLECGGESLIADYEARMGEKERLKQGKEEKKAERALAKAAKADSPVKAKKGKRAAEGTGRETRVKLSGAKPKSKGQKLVESTDEEDEEPRVARTTMARWKDASGLINAASWLDSEDDTKAPTPSTSTLPSVQPFLPAKKKEALLRPFAALSEPSDSDSHITKSPKKNKRQVSRERKKPSPTIDVFDSDDEATTLELDTKTSSTGGTSTVKKRVAGKALAPAKSRSQIEVIDLCTDSD